MPGRRPLAAGELAAHLAWARIAVDDRHLDVRLVLAAILDAVEAAVDLLPGRPE